MDISWEWFTKIAVVLGVLGTLVTLATYFTKSKPELFVTVSYSSFTWPTIPDIPSLKKDDHFEMYEEIINSLKILKEFSSIQSAWYLRIHNSGNKEAKNLRLKIPHTYSYQLDRDGFELVMKEYHEFISIKDIQPDESIFVVGWVTKSLGDEDIEEVKLTHSNGVADKTALMNVERHWKWISDNWHHFVILPYFGYLIFLLLKKNKENNEKA